MLSAIVRWSLVRPRLVAVAALLLFIYGCIVLAHAKFDVFPEFVPAQAEMQTEAPGLTAEQVEQLVTRPVEQAVNGAAGRGQGALGVDPGHLGGQRHLRRGARALSRPSGGGRSAGRGAGQPAGRRPAAQGRAADLFDHGPAENRLHLRQADAHAAARPGAVDRAAAPAGRRRGGPRHGLWRARCGASRCGCAPTTWRPATSALADVLAAVQASTGVSGGGYHRHPAAAHPDRAAGPGDAAPPTSPPRPIPSTTAWRCPLRVGRRGRGGRRPGARHRRRR